MAFNSDNCKEICFSAYLDESNKDIFDACEKELEKNNIKLCVRNLSGSMMNSAFDFTDLELIAFTYQLIQTFLISGAYDIFKNYIISLWNIASTHTSYRVPFTVTISGIPTVNGSENVKCKISGHLSKKQKEKVIDNAFNLAQQIERDQFKLLKRSKFYDTFGAHVFNYNTENNSLSEIDIDEEVKKKMNGSDNDET